MNLGFFPPVKKMSVAHFFLLPEKLKENSKTRGSLKIILLLEVNKPKRSYYPNNYFQNFPQSPKTCLECFNLHFKSQHGTLFCLTTNIHNIGGLNNILFQKKSLYPNFQNLVFFKFFSKSFKYSASKMNHN